VLTETKFQPRLQPGDVCVLLPPGARELLIRAAHDASLAETEIQREAILDDTFALVRSKYPAYFR